MFTRMYINYCSILRKWRTATGTYGCPKTPVWGGFSGIPRKCIYYDICITILAPSCKQTSYPQKLQLSFLFFRIGPKLNSIQDFVMLFKSCNFQNRVAIPVATVAIFVAIKLQLIAIAIKYSCYKDMYVKDLE